MRPKRGKCFGTGSNQQLELGYVPSFFNHYWKEPRGDSKTVEVAWHERNASYRGSPRTNTVETFPLVLQSHDGGSAFWANNCWLISPQDRWADNFFYLFSGRDPYLILPRQGFGCFPFRRWAIAWSSAFLTCWLRALRFVLIVVPAFMSEGGRHSLISSLLRGCGYLDKAVVWKHRMQARTKRIVKHFSLIHFLRSVSLEKGVPFCFVRIVRNLWKRYDARWSAPPS